MRKKRSARFESEVARQPANASRATPTARSISSTDANVTSPDCEPVAGLYTAPVRPDVPPTGSPPIQWSIVFNSVVTAPMCATSVRFVEAYRPSGERLKAPRSAADPMEVSKLVCRIRDLEAEERALSARRARLHNRIDFLRSGGGGPADEVAARLDGLEREEREVSTRRRELHATIAAARTELVASR